MLRPQAVELAPSLIMNDTLNYTLLYRCNLIDCFARQYILPALLNVSIRLANPVTTFYTLLGHEKNGFTWACKMASHD